MRDLSKMSHGLFLPSAEVHRIGNLWFSSKALQWNTASLGGVQSRVNLSENFM